MDDRMRGVRRLGALLLRRCRAGCRCLRQQRAMARARRARCSRRPSAGPTRSRAAILNFSLTLTPSGSSTLKGPISLASAVRSRARAPASCRSRTSTSPQRGGPARPARVGLDRHQRVRDAAGRQLPAPGRDVPEARVELRRASASSPRAGRAPEHSASSASTRCDWLTDPTVVGTETASPGPTRPTSAPAINVAATARGPQHVPAARRRRSGLGREQDPDQHLAVDPQPDRERGPEPDVRRLDRQRRQDACASW